MSTTSSTKRQFLEEKLFKQLREQAEELIFRSEETGRRAVRLLTHIPEDAGGLPLPSRDIKCKERWESFRSAHAVKVMYARSWNSY